MLIMMNDFPLCRRFAAMTQVKTFGKSFLYSNMMYGFASYLSERLGMDSWENLVTSEIFQRLDMTSSTFITTLADLSGAAQGYDKGPKSKPKAVVPVPLEFSKYVESISDCNLNNTILNLTITVFVWIKKNR